MTFVHADEPVHRTVPTPMDDAAFERACAREWPRVIRYLRAIASAELDIEDLGGRVIETAWKRRGDLQDPAAFTPWLLAITTNVARNGHRGSRRLVRLRARLTATAERRTSPSAHAELLRMQPGPATRALATLADPDRQILVLHAWEELANEEIADVLDISSAAVAQRLLRARKRLAAALESTTTEVSS